MFKTISIILLIKICLIYGQTDKTLEDRATGYDVVQEVVKKIKDSGIFKDDKDIIKRIAYVESRFGEDPNTFKGDNYGGIWQIDYDYFNEIIEQTDKFILSAIKDKLGIDFQNVEYKQLLKPLYSGLLARMFLNIKGANIPDQSDIDGQAVYCQEYYNIAEGKGSIEKFIEDINEMKRLYEKDCRGLMDLAIVLDGSISIGYENYEKAKNFVVNFTKTFSLNTTNIGFVVFSSDTKIIFSLNSNLTYAQMESSIINSTYPNQFTNTNLGIETGVKILQDAVERPGVPKIMAVFTDGEPTCSDESFNRSLNLARANNVTIVAYGISGSRYFLKERLLKMTKRVFIKTSYEELSKSFQEINNELCKIPQTPELNSRTTDVLGESEKRFYKYELPPNGLTFKLNNLAGKTKAYYSFSNENPSSALNDGEFSDHLDMQGDSDYQEWDTSRTLYLALEGLGSNNKYSLNSELGHNGSGVIGLKSNPDIILLIISYIVFQIITKFII